MKFKVEKMGEAVEGVTITGKVKNCEPAHFRICFPFGDVEVTRATDGPGCDYWVHVRVNTPKCGHFDPSEVLFGTIKDARLDLHGKNGGEPAIGDFDSPELYHLAVRVGATKENNLVQHQAKPV